MLHCSKCERIIKPYDIWFLYDINGFFQRRLEIGKCPKCKKDIAALYEIRKTDCKPFIDRQYGEYATNLIDRCITQLWYRQKDTIFQKGRPYGFIWGDNRENRKERKTYACDFYGNKELIESLPR